MDICESSTSSSRQRKTRTSSNRNIASSTQGGRIPPQRPYILPVPSTCDYCGAKLFKNESPLFCCNHGQVQLASNRPPEVLEQLFKSRDEKGEHFRKYILLYNSQFAYTSLGVKKDKTLARRDHGVYTFKVQGQAYHYINDVLPGEATPRYTQLYFYDTDLQLQYRMQAHENLLASVISMVMRVTELNPYAYFFKSLRDFDLDETSRIIIRSSPNEDQRTHNAPSVSQVAAIWIEDGDSADPPTRDIVVRAHSGGSHRIQHYYGCYDPLQYPLLFPYGESGWHQGIYKQSPNRQRREQPNTFPINEVLVQEIDDLLEAEEQDARSSTSDKKVSCREYYCYKLQIRISDRVILLHSARLLQQYTVDMYIKIESTRLDYFRLHQDTIRAELYQGIVDSMNQGQTQSSNIGRRFILPPSFIGGPRDMRRRYLDAMALVHRYGKPDIFLTMTCDNWWPDIQQELQPYEEAQNRPDLSDRIFHAKLAELKKDIIKNKLFGNVAAFVYVIEFQKRGLPHVHFLIILDSENKIRNPEQYDMHVCAEIPNRIENPHLYESVLRHMMHDPCGVLNPANVCMKDGSCKNHYPREYADVTTNGRNSYPIYRRRNNGTVATIRGKTLDNRWVVPYNPFLLAKYDCHINVEVCSTIKAVKYLYKYIYKGHDQIQFTVSSSGSTSATDEITSFQSARWVSPPEAVWRIFRFALNDIHPNVVPLQLHLPNMQNVVFREVENLQNIIDDYDRRKTMLTAFFETNQKDQHARTLLYHQFPEHYVWHPKRAERFWARRKKGFAIGRVVYANPVEGELYYLRILLLNVCGPQSFEVLLKCKGVQYSSFRDAAYQRGLLEADDSIDQCLEEAVQFQTPYVLRRLFVTLLIYCQPKSPMSLWDKYYPSLSEDFSHANPRDARKVQILTLRNVAKIVESMGKDFSKIGLRGLEINEDSEEQKMREIEEEMSIPISIADIDSVHLLNNEQQIAYDIIYRRILQNKPGAFFVDGPGGTGKTFLYSALLANLRMQGMIAIAVATSGIAASNMPGGRTANSRFKIPLDVEETRNTQIPKQGALAELIKRSRLIIWDEASMAKRQTIEHFERTLRDICSSNTVFGGKIVVFGGDFRQVLPVIPKSTMREAVNASFVMSPLWMMLERIQLTQNMRAIHDPFFSDFVLQVGNGTPPYENHQEMLLPPSIAAHCRDEMATIEHLIQTVYPDVGDILSNPHLASSRAILTPRNDDAEKINCVLVSRQPGESIEYKSFDGATDESPEQYPTEFLNTLQPNGFPPYRLTLKKNSPIILLRNLDPTAGLCNGTRLICRAFFPNVIDAEISTGHHKGERVFIPRIPLKPAVVDKYPFLFKRTQFPIRLSFAMTINKAQGQTLDKVGIYLPQPVFSHGQLYVVLSRAKKSLDITVGIKPIADDDDSWRKTKNMVCYEILQRSGII